VTGAQSCCDVPGGLGRMGPAYPAFRFAPRWAIMTRPAGSEDIRVKFNVSELGHVSERARAFLPQPKERFLPFLP